MTKNEQLAAELSNYSAGSFALVDLTKDALIELHREAFGNVGDTGRTPRGEYINRLTKYAETQNLGQKAIDAACRLASAVVVPTVKETLTPEPQPITKEAPKMQAQTLDLQQPTIKTVPAVSPVPVAPAAAADQLAAIIASIAAANAPKQEANIDEEAVKRIIRAEMGSIKPLQITIEGITKPETKAEHRHPMFEKVLKLAAAGQNVLMVGPAGTGKTHLAGQVAAALDRDYGALHCTAGASESQLTGWLLPTGENGTFEYAPAPFVTLYENGNSLFLLDEIDAADPNMLMCINGALANGHLHIPHRLDNPAAIRGPQSAIIAAANTFGTGADFLYSGRNQLDAATLDRFYTVWIDYDRAFERTQLQDAALLAWIWEIREKVAAAKMRRVISTRAIQKAATAQAIGFDNAEIKRDLLQGWTRDELAKVGA